MIRDSAEFSEEDREQFRSGQLRDEWAEKYPQLFDEDDVRIARTQAHYHFYEWFAAVHYYRGKGYLSLVEQYQFPLHQGKRLIITRLMSPDLIRFIETGSAQAPDLLVYAPDYSDWYFCEVKGPGDRLSSKQTRWFLDLEAQSGKEVVVLYLRPKPS